ncbi:MAG: nickel-dependent hydrogenase large subunit [Candidatus Bathyarchaeota archaeon]|nr:MAG: nickel-dependent hydrogenase large subunit [Candidatus Bathyarchaeota archaeon]
MSEQVRIGPFDPRLIEPEIYELTVKDGVIVDADMQLGHLHRGIEKIASTRPYRKGIFVCARVCGICSNSHSFCFAQTAEGVMDVEVPERALYLRAIMHEVERLESHYIWFAILAHALKDMEFFTKVIGDRESVMDLQEYVTGNRVTKGFNAVGGVRFDFNDATVKKTLETVEISRKLSDFIGKKLKDKTIKSHLEGFGILDKKQARLTGAVGPTVRGSGISDDIRRDDPYAVYDRLDFDVIVEDGCDVLARTLVRHREAYESMKMIQQGLKDLPEGPILGDIREVLETDYVSHVESHRGELLYYMKGDGTNIPARVKIRTPSFMNDKATLEMLKGDKVENAQVIIESIDPCFSCTDRVTIVSLDDGTRKSVPMDSLSKAVK